MTIRAYLDCAVAKRQPNRSQGLLQIPRPVRDPSALRPNIYARIKITNKKCFGGEHFFGQTFDEFKDRPFASIVAK